MSAAVEKDASIMKIAFQSAVAMKDHFINNPSFNPDSYGLNSSHTDHLIQYFNLSGEVPGKIALLDLLKSGSKLNREKLCAHLTTVKSSLRDVILHSCAEDISLIPSLATFFRICGFDAFQDLEELRHWKFIENFCEIYSKSFHALSIIDSSNIKTAVVEHSLKVTGRDAAFSGRLNDMIVNTLADLCFSTLLLAQSFRKGIYDEDALFRDYCQRISSIEVNGSAETVPSQLLKECFEKTKASMYVFCCPQGGRDADPSTSKSPSYLFAKTFFSATVDWSFRDFETMTGNTVYLTKDAMYFFTSSITCKPVHCIPLVYLRVEQEDGNGNIMHISSLESDVFPVISYESSPSIVFYTSSTWIEFSNSSTLLTFVDNLEVLIEDALAEAGGGVY